MNNKLVLGDIATSYYTLMSPYQISRIPLAKVDKNKCINGFTCFEWNSKILDYYTPGLYTAKAYNTIHRLLIIAKNVKYHIIEQMVENREAY